MNQIIKNQLIKKTMKKVPFVLLCAGFLILVSNPGILGRILEKVIEVSDTLERGSYILLGTGALTFLIGVRLFLERRKERTEPEEKN